MATKRIKDITNTAASVASDAYLAIDGTSNGTEKITRDNFRQDTADAFVAAPGTYNLAPLSGGAVEVAKGGTGATTAAGARTNLSVNSIDEDAQANALKTTAPALYFDGTSSYATVADSDKLTFSSSVEFGTNSSGTWSPNDNTPALTDGTGTTNQHYRVDSGAGTVTQGGSTLSVINGTATTAGQAVYYDGAVWRLKDVDDLPFSISAWVKPSDITSLRPIVSKYSSSGEYLFYFTSGKLVFLLRDAAVQPLLSTAALTVSVDEWFHVCVTYAGAGPNKANGFASAASGIQLFVNGKDLTSGGTVVNEAGYTGMQDTTNTLQIGGAGSDYFRGHIRGLKIFNRSLTSTEVAELARGNDLGFADEWGGAFGAIETSNFSGGVDGYSGSAGVLAGASTVGGESDALKFTVDNTSGTHSFSQLFSSIQVGKRYRIAFRYYVQSGQSNVDSLTVRYNNGSFDAGYGTTNDAWTPFVYEGIAADQTVEFYAADGSNINFQDAGGDDDIYVKDITITEIGTLADFRSERYDTSTNKLYDLSDNAFVGTGTSVTLTGREVPVYTTGQWTPVLIGATTSDFTYSLQEGFYTRIGDLCYVHGIVSISNLGTSAGAMSIGGLPFTSLNASGQQIPATIGFASGFTGLTSSLSAAFGDNSTTISLWKWAATGVSSVIETDMTNSADIRFGGVYKIQ